MTTRDRIKLEVYLYLDNTPGEVLYSKESAAHRVRNLIAEAHPDSRPTVSTTNYWAEVSDADVQQADARIERVSAEQLSSTRIVRFEGDSKVQGIAGGRFFPSTPPTEETD